MILLVCAGELSFAQSQLPPTTAPDTVARIVDNRPRIAYSLRLPMGKAEIEQYAGMLGLADGQRAFLASIHQPYSAECLALETKCVPAMEELAAEVVVAKQGGDPGSAAVMFADLIRQEGRFNDLIRQHDDSFLGAIADVLSEQQLPELARVRARRDRACCSRLSRMVPTANFDFSELALAWRIDDDSRQRMEPVLREYETALTPAWLALERSIAENRVHVDGIESAMQLGQISRQEFVEQRGSVFRRQAELQRRVADINKEFLPRLLERLSPTQASEIQESYLALAYPVVYPDSVDPRSVLVDLFAALEPDSDSQHRSNAILADHVKQHAVLSEEMVNRFVAYQMSVAESWSARDFAPYAARMRELRQQRWQLDIRTVRAAHELFAISDVDARALLKDRDAGITGAMTIGFSDHYPPQ